MGRLNWIISLLISGLPISLPPLPPASIPKDWLLLHHKQAKSHVGGIHDTGVLSHWNLIRAKQHAPAWVYLTHFSFSPHTHTGELDFHMDASTLSLDPSNLVGKWCFQGIIQTKTVRPIPLPISFMTDHNSFKTKFLSQCSTAGPSTCYTLQHLWR